MIAIKHQAEVQNLDYLHYTLKQQPWSENLVAVLECYLDESADGRNEDVVAIAGFLSHPHIWFKVSAEWNKVLGDTVFHMTDFEARQDVFKHWDDTRRLNTITSLIDSVTSNVLLGFGSVVMIKDISAVMPGLPAEDARTIAKNLCFYQCVVQMASYARGVEECIRFIFDQTEAFEFDAHRMHREMRNIKSWPNRARIGSLSFESRQTIRPLQVADVAAYETYKHNYNKRNHPTVPMRKPLQRMIDAGQFNMYRWTTPYIERFANRLIDRVGDPAAFVDYLDSSDLGLKIPTAEKETP